MSKLCKWCGSDQHTSFYCYKKVNKPIAHSTKPLKRPIKPIRHESYKSKQKREATSALWYKINQPDSRGYWYCYLCISPRCLYRLDRMDVTLEHVRSKARAKHLQYDVNNLRPACSFCNEKKRSLDLIDLVAEFPHLQVYIDA